LWCGGDLVTLAREGGVQDALHRTSDVLPIALGRRQRLLRRAGHVELEQLGRQHRESGSHLRVHLKAHHELDTHRRLEDALPSKRLERALFRAGAKDTQGGLKLLVRATRPSTLVVRPCVVCEAEEARVTKLERSPVRGRRSERRLVRPKGDERTARAEALATAHVAKDAEGVANVPCVHVLGQFAHVHGAVEVGRSRRNLLHLEDRRAQSRGVPVGGGMLGA